MDAMHELMDDMAAWATKRAEARGTGPAWAVTHPQWRSSEPGAFDDVCVPVAVEQRAPQHMPDNGRATTLFLLACALVAGAVAISGVLAS